MDLRPEHIFSRVSKRGFRTRYGAEDETSEDEFSSQDEGTEVQSYSIVKTAKLSKLQQQKLLRARLEAAMHRELAQKQTKSRHNSSIIRYHSKTIQQDGKPVSVTTVTTSDRNAEAVFFDGILPSPQRTGMSSLEARRLQGVPVRASQQPGVSAPIIARTATLSHHGKPIMRNLPDPEVELAAVQPVGFEPRDMTDEAAAQFAVGYDPVLVKRSKPMVIEPAITMPEEPLIVVSPSQKDVDELMNDPKLGGLGTTFEGKPMLAIGPTHIVGIDDALLDQHMEENGGMDMLAMHAPMMVDQQTAPVQPGPGVGNDSAGATQEVPGKSNKEPGQDV
eukprot:TRINITY_DN9125_c0_g1_i2.p2 TRINITY_DN9125_c0_g1~~TRINITY_DN9125_c0_g1_i2.p2  ORF type:complete len:334 (+),score=37.57 TRINITY_DN9125_c0_g1_i2:58-1059(+)